MRARYSSRIKKTITDCIKNGESTSISYVCNSRDIGLSRWTLLRKLERGGNELRDISKRSKERYGNAVSYAFQYEPGRY